MTDKEIKEALAKAHQNGREMAIIELKEKVMELEKNSKGFDFVIDLIKLLKEFK